MARALDATALQRATQRQAARRALGLAAERAVSDWLRQRGLEILASNVRVGYLEVDLLVRDGRTLVLVEVRTRGAASWTSAFGSVDGWKRTRLRRAAERLWQRKYRFFPDFDHVRCDVASVSWQAGNPHIEYVRAAF